MDEFHCELKNGEKMKIKVLTPPIEFEQSMAEKTFWWNDIRDRALKGELERGNLCVKLFLGDSGGEYLGSVVLLTPKPESDIGLVEFVGTSPEHRNKGVAGAILDALIKCFEENGGLALYLCTTNPIAYELYKKKGFASCIGDGMRRITSLNHEFDEGYLSYTGPPQIRVAEWGDMPRFAPLFNNPHNVFFIKDFILPVFHDGRYESHFKKMLLPQEKGEGGLLVLESPDRCIVGSCFLKVGPSFYEQHIGLIDYMIAPDYSGYVGDLLAAACEKAKELGLEMLLNRGAGCDTPKLAAFKDAGFNCDICVKNYFKTENERYDLMISVRELQQGGARRKTRGEYYGLKPDWL